MRNTIILSGLLLLTAACQQRNTDQTTAQKSTDSSTIPQHPKQVTREMPDLPHGIAQFVPAGYTAIDTTSGDLNLDQYPDMVMVLKKNDEALNTGDAHANPEKRPLLLLIGQADNSYKAVKRNDNVVLCADCGGAQGDPFTGIAIKRGYFSIEHGMAGGAQHIRVITFKYDRQRADWFLHQEGAINYKFNDSTDDFAEALEKDNEQIRRKKDFGLVPFEQYNIYMK